MVGGDAGPLSEAEAAKRIDATWREAFIAMCDDLPARPHQAFYDVASPSKGRRPWFGIVRNADRVQAKGGRVDTIEHALHDAVTRMCAVMRRRDPAAIRIGRDDTPRAA